MYIIHSNIFDTYYNLLVYVVHVQEADERIFLIDIYVYNLVLFCFFKLIINLSLIYIFEKDHNSNML